MHLGRGGEVDIAAPEIAVVGAGGTAPDGYLTLTPQAIASLDATSVLLGGTRTNTNGTDQIAVTVLGNLNGLKLTRDQLAC